MFGECEFSISDCSDCAIFVSARKVNEVLTSSFCLVCDLMLIIRYYSRYCFEYFLCTSITVEHLITETRSKIVPA
jgi:hypothetical protein